MRVALLEKIPLAMQTLGLRFARPAEFAAFKPGQYLVMTLEIPQPDVKGKIRSFSIASSPTEPDSLLVATRESGSTFKQTLAALTRESAVEIKGPVGRFVLEENAARPVVMIAGGIGITPFRSMIRYATDRGLPIPITLLYSNRMPEMITFRDDFDRWQITNPNLRIIYTLDSPPSSWAGQTGLINAEFLRKHVGDTGQSVYYVCGPPGMVDVMLATLKNDLGLPPEQVKFERFVGYATVNLCDACEIPLAQ